MSIERDGKTYYSEEEVKLRRREADKVIPEVWDLFAKELHSKWDSLLKQMQEMNVSIQLLKQTIDKEVLEKLKFHDKLISGNGKEGCVTILSNLTKTLESLSSDVWDKENGLGVKIEKLWEKKKEYDSVVQKIQNVEIKVAGIASIVGVIVAWLANVFHFTGQISK
jgi:hypothetical protein